MAFDLCKILGVEEGEVFKLNGAEYKIIGNKMYHLDGVFSKAWTKVDYPLNLLAEAEIERLPFVPALDKSYFYVDYDLSVQKTCNDCVSEDIYRIKLGVCYRTAEEAKEKGVPLMQQWLKEIRGE